ncbi:MAG: MMPL family transporter [Verrucomicrobiae bacterium]|nr:MMPL family transporter [Verrucomicrobiae bacterium]
MPLIHRLFQKMLQKLAVGVCRFPLAILLTALVLTVASGYLTWKHFNVVNNIAQLLDDNSPTNRDYLALQKEFGTDEVYLVLIQSDDPQQNRAVALKVGEYLKTLQPRIARVYCRMDLSRMQSRFLVFLPKEDLLDIEKQLETQSGALKKTNVTFDLNSVLDQASRSFDDKYLRKKESWKEFKPFIEQFKQVLNQVADEIEGRKAKPVHVSEKNLNLKKFDAADINEILEDKQFISFGGGQTILVVGVRGEPEVGSVSPFTQTVARIRGYLKELNKEYPSVKLGVTGEPVLNDDELRTSTRDTELAALITFALIAILFFLAYRNLERPLYAGLVLGMGIAWTFAFTMLVIGHFNIISFAVIPMVLGLGIDFGIQVLGRYEEELGNGRPVDESVYRALGITGVAVLTGGSTTAAAFFTLCFNGFLGLRELGAVAGVSMVLCLIANLVVLPAIFVLRDRSRAPEKLKKQAENSWAFMAPLDRKMVLFPWTGVFLTIVITGLSIYGIFLVRFDYNLLHLQNQKMDSVRVLHEIFKASENSTLFASVLVDNMDEARAMTKRLEALPSVAKVDSITNILPEGQEEKLPVIRRILKRLDTLKVDTNVADKVDVARAQRDLKYFYEACREGVVQARKYQKISNQAKEAVLVFNGLMPPLERAMKAMNGLTQEELGKRMNKSQVKVFGAMRRNLAWMKKQKADRLVTQEDLPEEISSRFVSKSGKILLQVYSKGDIWEREPNKKFVEDLRSVAPHVTGTPVQNYEYVELLRTSFLDASVWAFVVIVILIVMHFQTPKYVTLALFPLVLAVIWRTGLMGWWDLPFNPANVVTLPLIIGIDVAYGVYIVDRYREDGRITMFSTSTGKAIVMTGLASLFGFVSLLVSRYEGMYSIGLLMSLGIIIGMFTTIVVLPQVLELLGRNSRVGNQDSKS